MFDTHIHTDFSTDSKMNVEEAIGIAKEKRIGLIITDHMDTGVCDDGRFVFNPDEFFSEYSKYRDDKLLLGIEIGIRNECAEENRKIVEGYPFDYVLGSLHIVNGLDPYYEEYFKGKTKKQAYEEYFICMAECLKTHNFIDSLGHIEYIARYGRYEDREPYYDEYREYIDEILKIVSEMGISLEINTRRLEDKTAFENYLRICRRFRELGGETVTIGSDAHRAEAIGFSLGAAADMAEAAGLKVVYYKNRKMEYLL